MNRGLACLMSLILMLSAPKYSDNKLLNVASKFVDEIGSADTNDAENNIECSKGSTLLIRFWA